MLRYGTKLFYPVVWVDKFMEIYAILSATKQFGSKKL
jgi:hypothetical protein